MLLLCMAPCAFDFYVHYIMYLLWNIRYMLEAIKLFVYIRSAMGTQPLISYSCKRLAHNSVVYCAFSSGSSLSPTEGIISCPPPFDSCKVMHSGAKLGEIS